MLQLPRLAALAALFFLASCETTQNAQQIVGSWTGTEWLVNGEPSGNNARQTSFRFEADGNYVYDYAGSAEHGLYKIYEDKLYTTPTGGQEMLVRIVKLTKDSLVFDMNRAGRPETLTLLRR